MTCVCVCVCGVCLCVCVCVFVVCVCVCVCEVYVLSQSRQLFCYSYIIPLSFRPLFGHSLHHSHQILKHLPVICLTYEKVHYSFCVFFLFPVALQSNLGLESPRFEASR